MCVCGSECELRKHRIQLRHMRKRAVRHMGKRGAFRLSRLKPDGSLSRRERRCETLARRVGRKVGRLSHTRRPIPLSAEGRRVCAWCGVTQPRARQPLALCFGLRSGALEAEVMQRPQFMRIRFKSLPSLHPKAYRVRRQRHADLLEDGCRHWTCHLFLGRDLGSYIT